MPAVITQNTSPIDIGLQDSPFRGNGWGLCQWRRRDIRSPAKVFLPAETSGAHSTFRNYTQVWTWQLDPQTRRGKCLPSKSQLLVGNIGKGLSRQYVMRRKTFSNFATKKLCWPLGHERLEPSLIDVNVQGDRADFGPTWNLQTNSGGPVILHKGDSSAIDIEEVQWMIDSSMKRGPKIPKYIHPYPPYVEKFEYPRGFKIPDFSLFGGDSSLSSLEHVARFSAQCGDANHDYHKLRLFNYSLTATTFSRYINLPLNSVQNLGWSSQKVPWAVSPRDGQNTHRYE